MGARSAGGAATTTASHSSRDQGRFARGAPLGCLIFFSLAAGLTSTPSSRSTANVADALRALPKHDATTLLVNSRGLPWREDGFRGSFFRLIRQLEAAGKVADGLTFHGLRHTAATRMRRLGFDKETIADMLGQDTPGMAGHYSREADLEPKLRGVVKRIERENRKRTNLSNQA